MTTNPPSDESEKIENDLVKELRDVIREHALADLALRRAVLRRMIDVAFGKNGERFPASLRGWIIYGLILAIIAILLLYLTGLR